MKSESSCVGFYSTLPAGDGLNIALRLFWLLVPTRRSASVTHIAFMKVYLPSRLCANPKQSLQKFSAFICRFQPNYSILAKLAIVEPSDELLIFRETKLCRILFRFSALFQREHKHAFPRTCADISVHAYDFDTDVFFDKTREFLGEVFDEPSAHLLN